MKFKEFLQIKYGKNQSDIFSHNGNIPIFGTGGIFGYASKYIYDKPSVLIGRKGTINNPFFVKYPFWTIDTLFYTVINDSLVNPQWFYYKCLTIDFLQYNEGTTIPSLTTKSLYEIEIDVPNLDIQQHIVDIRRIHH